MLDFVEIKKNLNRQGTKILFDIANAYETGVFDDPKSSVLYCSLLACICEGKVEGVFDEDTAKVKWSLTRDYSDQLDALYSEAAKSDKIVRGPWT